MGRQKRTMLIVFCRIRTVGYCVDQLIASLNCHYMYMYSFRYLYGGAVELFIGCLAVGSGDSASILSTTNFYASRFVSHPLAEITDSEPSGNGSVCSCLLWSTLLSLYPRGGDGVSPLCCAFKRAEQKKLNLDRW